MTTSRKEHEADRRNAVMGAFNDGKWLTVSDLSDITGINRKTIRPWIYWLVREGVLARKIRGTDMRLVYYQKIDDIPTSSIMEK